MRRMRSGLLFAAAVTLIGLGASPVSAQVAPTLTGETGLIELSNADMIPQGHFAFGLFFSQSDRTAAPSLFYGPGASDPLRYGYGRLGVTVAFAAMDNFQITGGTGERFYYADARDWSGIIEGRERQGRIRHSETDKIRFGMKVLLNPRVDPVKVVLLAGWSIPTQTRSDPGALGSYRADYDFGISFNYGIATFQTQYVITGDFTGDDQREDFQIPNELRAGLGFGIPIIPNMLKGIAEVNRIHFDGGTSKPPDFSEVLLGARLGLGHTGIAATGAVRVNIDRWIKYGNKPSNIGGVIQLAWSPQPPSAVAATVPAAMTPEEPAPSAAPAPAPAEPAPPAATPSPVPPTSVEPPAPTRPETSTTDEVLYDAGKSRLTNIAKAILDGVALRLKNNLAATCTVTGYADKGEKGDRMALSRARAEAAKDYLVKRHGIDAGRIKTDARGDAEAGPDGTRNRRAVVTVSFP